MILKLKIKELSKLDGWIEHSTNPDVMCFYEYERLIYESHIMSDRLIKYAISYDCIIKLIKKYIDESKWDIFSDNLNKCFTALQLLTSFSPEQLGDALLKTLDKWKE